MIETTVKPDESKESSQEVARKEESSKSNSYFKEWELAPGMKGIYISFSLLIAGMVASIIAQNYEINNYNSSSNWLQGCPSGYENSCVGNGAVYRFSFALVIIYSFQLIGSTIHVAFFDAFWIIKLLIFIGIVIGFYQTNASVFDDHGYAWFARIAAFFYVILQQIILIDFAYIINERLISLAEADTESKKWYAIILIIAIILFSGSYAAIGVMFWEFTGCGSNDTILALTTFLPLAATCIQVFGSEEGSILTSAIMTAYATYVCFSAITLNPDPTCNPTISSSGQTVSTAIGLTLTVISITWTTYTAIKKIPGAIQIAEILPTTATDESQKPDNQSLRVIFQEVSVVFILISAYYCMVLTNWATLQTSHSISNPRFGQVSLWLQAAAQWIAIIIYCWTLIAPKLLPDRDFS